MVYASGSASKINVCRWIVTSTIGNWDYILKMRVKEMKSNNQPPTHLYCQLPSDISWVCKLSIFPRHWGGGTIMKHLHSAAWATIAMSLIPRHLWHMLVSSLHFWCLLRLLDVGSTNKRHQPMIHLSWVQLDKRRDPIANAPGVTSYWVLVTGFLVMKLFPWS